MHKRLRRNVMLVCLTVSVLSCAVCWIVYLKTTSISNPNLLEANWPRQKGTQVLAKVMSAVPAARQNGRTQFLITMQVEKVITGSFEDDQISFNVHSPSMCGLVPGRSLPVVLVTRPNGYYVPQQQFENAPPDAME